jgi:eukaryotic-like serine/threonine-protein kinase
LSSAPDDPLIGTILADRYRIDKCLGEGGMGAVYLAEHVRMHKQFAVKLLHPEMGRLAEAVFRFQREAIAAGRVDHEHLVTATDFGELPDGSMYLVLEYVPGKSLGALLAEGPVPTVRALKIARQIAAALAAVHAVGVFHRDLKPDNVMLVERPGSDDDFVKLLDFGMAKVQMELADEQPQLTRAGLVFGTPRYMAPEQAGGEPTDHRADIYSLGIVLYAMLRGSPPFSADEIRDVLRMQRFDPPPPLPKEIDPAVAGFVMTLLAKDPKERVQTAEGVIQYIDRLLARIGRPKRRDRAGDLIALFNDRVVPLLRTPVGAISAGAGVLLVFVVTFFVARGMKSHDVEPAASVSAVAEEVASAAPSAERGMEALWVRAEVGDVAAWKELETHAEASRPAREWFVIGVARVTHNDVARGFDAYLHAMESDERYVNHPRILRDLFVAARSEPWQPALRVAAAMPGSPGADILFDVWASTPKATPATQRARELLATDAVRARASDAVRIAFDLRSAEGQPCDVRKPLVERAAKEGDMRSFRPLLILAARTGCGSRHKSDCFPCLREDDMLDKALEQTKNRPAPDYSRITAAK